MSGANQNTNTAPAQQGGADQSGSPGAGSGASHQTPPASEPHVQPPGSPASAEKPKQETKPKDGGEAPAKGDGAEAATAQPQGDDETAKRLAALEAANQEQAKTLEAAKQAMRDTVLEGLGILPTYRSFVPEFDPFSEKGKRAAEEWAGKHPEVRRPQQNQAPARKERDPAKAKNKLFGRRG